MPVSTLAPSQRRLTSRRSTSAASVPLELSGGSWPRSMLDARRDPGRDPPRPAENMSGRFLFIAYAGSKRRACRPRVGLTSKDHARSGLRNQSDRDVSQRISVAFADCFVRYCVRSEARERAGTGNALDGGGSRHRLRTAKTSKTSKTRNTRWRSGVRKRPAGGVDRETGARL